MKRSGNQPVPLPIRNAPTQLMKDLGYHDGYLYPHDFPGHFTPQQYLPDALVNERLWHGQHSPAEEKLYERMVNYWGDRYKILYYSNLLNSWGLLRLPSLVYDMLLPSISIGSVAMSVALLWQSVAEPYVI